MLLEHRSSIWIHRTFCPAHMLRGERGEAERILVALRECYPNLTLGKVQQNLPPLSRSTAIA
jgi:hypothetical protein